MVKVGVVMEGHRCPGVSYLRGRQLSGSSATQWVDSTGRHPAARLEVNRGRLQRLRTRCLLSVNVCSYHGNGSLGWHHGDGDALGGGLDERQRLGRPYRTTPDCQLLEKDRQMDC